MSFVDYIFAIIGGTKNSLQTALNAFFDSQKNNRIEYSKQAFSKGRQRIKPEAFQELFLATVSKFYEKAESNNWNGYHLFGIDGTRLNLPNTEELREIYGEQVSCAAPQVQALVSCVYDLLNGIIVDTKIESCKGNERETAEALIRAFSVAGVDKAVFIMDRGYPSAKLIHAIAESGHKFIMRCTWEFIRAMNLPECDNIIEYKFKKSDSSIKLRVVKLQISEENIEYLITNLFETSISLEDFKFLYKQRWGIESKYNDLKNKLEIENFTGYSPIAILQDFYATMLLANLAGVLQFQMHEEIEAMHANEENKYEYKLNVSRTISETKRTVIEMLSTTSKLKREILFVNITLRMKNAVVPVRPNRNFDRNRRHRSAKFPPNMKRG